MLGALGDRFSQFHDAQINAGMGGAAGFFAALNVAGDMIGVNGIIGGAVRQDLATGAPLSNAEGNAQIIVGSFSLATTFVGAGAAGAAGKAGSVVKGSGTAVKVTRVEVGPMKMLKQSETLGQRHHLNQHAVFGKTKKKPAGIPYDEGLAVRLKGNAFKEVEKPHFEAHAYLENFWDYFRKGQPGYRRLPTNHQYGLALESSLRRAGFSAGDAKGIAEIARQQRLAAGLADHAPVPFIPRRINQVAGCNPR